jgi:hypothetical protein
VQRGEQVANRVKENKKVHVEALRKLMGEKFGMF